MFNFLNSLVGEVRKMTSFDESTVNNLSEKYFKYLHPANDAFLNVCEQMFSAKDPVLFSIATKWIHKRPDIINLDNADTFTQWAEKYVDTNEKCYLYAKNVLNHLLCKHQKYYKKLIEFSASINIYLRKLSLETLTTSNGELTISLNKSLELISYLIDDDILIQETCGKLLLLIKNLNNDTFSRFASKHVLPSIINDIINKKTL